MTDGGEADGAVQEDQRAQTRLALGAMLVPLFFVVETGPSRPTPNLLYFNEVDKGGHFAPWEQPELFSTEIRAGFRSLKT